MNCANREEQIALYMGGDLTPVEAKEVERHLAECPGCQVFASGMRDSLKVLRDAHREGVTEAALAAVRTRVWSELAPRRRPLWRSPWVYGLAAAALLLAMVWMRPAGPRRRVEAPAKQIAIAPPPPAPEPVVERAPVRVVRVGARARRRHLAKPAGPPLVAVSPDEKPLVVKMVTEDPDVVIYWITDTRGE